MSRRHILGLSLGGFHRVSYTDWGDRQSRHVVVCVHGLTRNCRDFDVLAQALEGRCRVICPDIVGRGQSDWLQRKEDYVYPQYLADMTALIARVTAETGPEATIDWVGTSMGGVMGMLLAAQAQSPIRRLVVNDVGPFIPRAALERIASYVGKAPVFASIGDAERYVRQVSAPFGPLTDEQWRHLTQHNARQQGDGRWSMIYDPGIAAPFTCNPLKDVHLWDTWDRIACPALVLRGRDSDLLQADTVEEMKRRGPKAKVVEFAGVGHAPTLMSDEQVGPVLDFLLAPV